MAEAEIEVEDGFTTCDIAEAIRLAVQFYPPVTPDLDVDEGITTVEGMGQRQGL